MKKIVSKSVFNKLSSAGKKAIIKAAKSMTRKSSKKRKTTRKRRY